MFFLVFNFLVLTTQRQANLEIFTDESSYIEGAGGLQFAFEFNGSTTISSYSFLQSEYGTVSQENTTEALTNQSTEVFTAGYDQNTTLFELTSKMEDYHVDIEIDPENVRKAFKSYLTVHNNRFAPVVKIARA